MKPYVTKLGYASLVLTFTSLFIIYNYIPMELNMEHVQKIMYVHVPSVFIAYIAFVIVLYCSFGYIWTRKQTFDMMAVSAAEIGVLFMWLTLVTGALWGKPTWNTYWEWDARMTTTLILFLTYLAYLIFRFYIENKEQKALYSSIFGIIAFVNIPLVHMSVYWWNTLHQKSTEFPEGNREKVISKPFEYMLFLAVATFLFIFVYLLLKRYLLENENRKYHQILTNIDHL